MSFATALQSELSAYMLPLKVDLYERKTFLRNLLIMHSIIVASENLLRVAKDQTVNSKLRNYYIQHLEEEKDHASWLAEDLQTVGIDVCEFGAPKAIREMVGAVYYAIYHENSVALLGYMLLLENNQMSMERLEKLEQIYGKELLRTVRYHVIHDKEHIVDILRIIDSRTPEEQSLIREIAFQSAEKISIESRALAA